VGRGFRTGAKLRIKVNYRSDGRREDGEGSQIQKGAADPAAGCQTTRKPFSVTARRRGTGGVTTAKKGAGLKTSSGGREKIRQAGGGGPSLLTGHELAFRRVYESRPRGRGAEAPDDK